MNQVTLQRTTRPGETFAVGDLRVTPEAQALILRVRGSTVVWNRPVAVVVERAGHVQRIPIVDVTRRLQIGLVGIALLVAISRLGVSIWKKERARDRVSESFHRGD